MTEDETVPAHSSRQAGDAYLAAVSALLVAMATNGLVTPDEADTLVNAMPADDLQAGLRFAIKACGLHG